MEEDEEAEKGEGIGGESIEEEQDEELEDEDDENHGNKEACSSCDGMSKALLVVENVEHHRNSIFNRK